MIKAKDFLFEEVLANKSKVNWLSFLILSFVLFRISIGYVSHTPYKTTIVTAVVIGQKLVPLEKDASRYLHVQLDNSKGVITVKLPPKALIKVNHPIELHHFYSKATGKDHYVFLRYT